MAPISTPEGPQWKALVEALISRDRHALDRLLRKLKGNTALLGRTEPSLYHVAVLAAWPEAVAQLAAAGAPIAGADTLVELGSAAVQSLIIKLQQRGQKMSPSAKGYAISSR